MFTVILDLKISKNQKIFLLFLLIIIITNNNNYYYLIPAVSELNIMNVTEILFLMFLCFWQIKVSSAVIGTVGFFVAVKC